MKIKSIVTASICSFLFGSGVIFAKTNELVNVSTVPVEWRFNFELVNMPDNAERKMGLLGVNYLFDFTRWWYAGVAGYGAVTGERGGLFTLGLETGVQIEFFPDMFIDAGVYAGGGGGRTSLVGGGLMLRPHAGAAYRFEYFKVGVDASKVQFPDGSINSNQVAVNFAIPTDFTYHEATNNDRLYHIDYKDESTPYFDFTQYYLAALGQAYLQHSSSDDAGVKDTSSMGLAGVEIGRFLNSSWFAYFKGAGAFSGKHNGYMDIFGGIGYHYVIPALPQVALNSRVAAGMGGGGSVDTGGGMLLEPSVGLQYQFLPRVGVEIAGGYLFAPDGKFNTYTVTGKLTYAMLMGDVVTRPVEANFIDQCYFQSWRVNVFNQTYINAQRKNGVASRTVNLVGIKIDDVLMPHFYVSGQAASAYAGQAGGYSSGMLGVGLLSDLFLANKVDANAEVLVGAGGGGGLDVAGGAIMHPMVGLNFHLTRYLAASATVGRIIALRSGLNANTVNAGLTFNFATVEGEKS